MGLKTYSEKFIAEVLNLNLKTPPDIIYGLVNLSGNNAYSSYIDSIGKDAVVKTDKNSVKIEDAGNLTQDAIAFRENLFNKNLETPTDIAYGLKANNESLSTVNNFLSGRGDDASIHDYKVVNQNDVVSNSTNFRDNLIKKNLQTPPEVASYLSVYFLNDRGEQAVINDYVVNNDGDVSETLEYSSERELIKAFNKNKPISKLDPSENDPLYYELSNGSYNYSALLDGIGKLIDIRDLNVPNAKSVSLDSNQTPEITLELNLQQNKYIPSEINTYEPTVNDIKTTINYKNQNENTTYGNLSPQTYEPSSFISSSNLNVNVFSSSETKPDLLEYVLNTSKVPLKDDSLLMNIAALELKFNFESRIRQAIERETIGKTSIDEALTNPIAAANLLASPYRWVNIFERNYGISVASNPIGRAAEFIGSLAGVENPIALDFALSSRDDLQPNCFDSSNANTNATTSFGAFYQDVIGRTTSRKNDYNSYFLQRTGSGQKFSLFYSIGKNKYKPDYLADYQSTLAQLGQSFTEGLNSFTSILGLSEGRTPAGNYYIGSKDAEDPFYLLQDSDGDQIRSNEILTKTRTNNGEFEEPGYKSTDNANKGVSDYGSISTNFIWKKENSYDTVKINNEVKQFKNIDDLLRTDTSSLSYNKNFIECSILDKTKQLLNKGVNSIDQTITKFYDNYEFASKGSGVIKPEKIPNTDTNGDVIGYKYIVNGLVNGKRDDKLMYTEAPLCRTWVKTKPYSTIGNTMKFKELIRKERNSVIDRFGNYNIFPSELNVNKGYGRNDNNVGSATTEFFGATKARKYMFSIENLAWRDYKADNYYGKKDLPFCEQGPNGGRVMWFPPYGLSFTDDTAANWTTHQFLGRPEPIYTYNNTERIGTLNWKMIVDHPSILNVLVKKELAKLSDGEVDEILAAFWSGCIEFDTFELARIWGVFSQSDIDYFKLVLSEMDLSQPNEGVKSMLKNVITNSSTPTKTTQNDSVANPIQGSGAKFLFFENDVPLDPQKYPQSQGSIYLTGEVESFNEYFEKYKNLNTNEADDLNVNYYKNTKVSGERVSYYKTIGLGGDSIFTEDKYDQQYQKLYLEFVNGNKYDGFDINVKIKTYSSPIAPGSTQNEVNTYNVELAKRRFLSVVKWIVNGCYNNTTSTIFIDEECTLLVSENDFVINKESYTFYRKNSYGTIDKLVFNLNNAEGLTTKEAITAKIQNPNRFNDNIYFITPFYDPTVTEKKQCYCFETKEIADSIKNNLDDFNNQLINTSGVTEDQIGALYIPNDSELTAADVSCSMLSNVASYGRRAEVTITVDSNNIDKETANKENENNEQIANLSYKINRNNVTKREIAQKLLSTVVNECDYFELLREDSPVVYSSLKEKLKYFTPAFHSMTPEGLNSRLTFLQQCLRPGETIKKTINGEETCDASNTAFGKPPVCVLRIGDFYNTKIIITNLNIQYDDSLLDLNPEGIGVQPMIASITLSFKYIGGSGLRKPVDELQNALSFNYYANADIYDDRTFANKNQYERDLINLERSYFDANTLDLTSIVDKAEKIRPESFLSDIPIGTIGSITRRNDLQLAGGEYGYLLLNVSEFQANKVYEPYNLVSFQNNFYQRKYDFPNDPNKSNTETKQPTDTQYWENIPWKNYGEEAFQLEFNIISQEQNQITTEYFNTYQVNYKSLFSQLYTTYGEILANNIKLNTGYNNYELLLGLFLNNRSEINPNKNNLKEYFNSIANQKEYVEYGKINKLIDNDVWQNSIKIQPIKTHLYPQKYMFKIGDGKSLTNVKNGLKSGIFDISERYDCGNLTGGGDIGSDTAGMFVKSIDNIRYNLNDYLLYYSNEFIEKINNTLNHFWVFDDSAKNINKQYHLLFDVSEKFYLKETLIRVFENYVQKTYNNYNEIIENTQTNYEKLLTITSGLSIMLEGYDIANDKLFEVIPNEAQLSTNVNELFGYDPYKNFKSIGTTPNNELTFKDVRNICYDNNIDELIKLGNGLYFFRQITSDSQILSLSTSGTTKNDNLPISWVIQNNTDLDNSNKYNFTFNQTGVTINTTLDPLAKSGITNIYDLSESIGGKKYLNNDYYPMTYVFEKLNYEFFEFTNKTLDIMLADNFNVVDYMIKSFNNLSIDAQLKNLQEIDDNNILNEIFEIKTDLLYYLTEGFNDLDDFIKYEYTLFKELNKNMSNNLINEVLDLSAFLDIMFIGFIKDIQTTDIETLKNTVRTYNESIKTPKSLINKKMKIIDGVFETMNRYFDTVMSVTSGLYNSIMENNEKTILSFNETLNDNISVKDITPEFVLNSLLKGNDGDYTLTMKDAKKANLGGIIISYDIFNYYKDTLLE